MIVNRHGVIETEEVKALDAERQRDLEQKQERGVDEADSGGAAE
jgi:hypothetical protein